MMTIVEALKKDKIDRIEIGSKWLYWDEINNEFIVRESKSGRRGSCIIIRTKSEDEAVDVLVGGSE